MRKFKLKGLTIMAVLLVTVWPSIAQNQDVGMINHFNLEECVAYALEHNNNLKNAALDREIADKKVGETLADGLPQISGSLDLGYNYKVPTTQLPAILIPEEFRDPNTPVDGFVPVNFSTKYNGNASVNLEQMIFNGSYFVGLRAARTFTELSRKQEIKTKIEIIELVTKAYYLGLVTKSRLELVDRNYSRLDSLLSETKVLNENGFVEKIDVSRVQVQWNNIKVEKDYSHEILKQSMDLLKYYMGMDLNEELELAEDMNEIEFGLVDQAIIDDFEINDRIEISQLETEKNLVKLDIKNTNVKYLPELNLYGSLGANAGTESSSELLGFSKDPWFGLGTIGARLNLPIFDGFRKSNQIQQKKIQYKQLENSFEELKNTINGEQRLARLNYRQNLDRMKFQKENMELAEEVYKVTKIKYEEGLGSNLEVLDADADYKAAQVGYYDALFDAISSKIDLEKAYGVLLK